MTTISIEYKPQGDNLVAHVELPRGQVEIIVGEHTDRVQPLPGMDMVDVKRRAFAVFRDGHRLTSGQGTSVTQEAIFRAVRKALLRIAAQDTVGGTCETCGEHTYPLQDPTKNTHPLRDQDKKNDDRIVCPTCKNGRSKSACTTCMTIGYMYRSNFGDLRCISKKCDSRVKGIRS